MDEVFTFLVDSKNFPTFIFSLSLFGIRTIYIILGLPFSFLRFTLKLEGWETLFRIVYHCQVSIILYASLYFFTMQKIHSRMFGFYLFIHRFPLEVNPTENGVKRSAFQLVTHYACYLLSPFFRISITIFRLQKMSGKVTRPYLFLPVSP